MQITFIVFIRWTNAMDGREAEGDVYMPSPLGPAMKADLPDVANYVRFA
jgi:putative ABC transport system permease protein